MTIKKYNGVFTKPCDDLYSMGLLERRPTQIKPKLMWDDGVNARFSFRAMMPSKFMQVKDLLLDAAYEELARYSEEEYRWRFVRFEVQLYRSLKGRKALPPTQTYTAGKHVDNRILVWGPEGGVPDEKTNFLIDIVEDILDIPMRYLGKVEKQRPYRVLYMEVCFRKGKK